MKHLPAWIVLCTASLMSIIGAPLIGAIPLHLSQPFDAVTQTILFDIRIPRTVAAFIAGGALAICGVLLQALFRNPLADPFTLGVASGASFGAASTILLGATAAFAIPLGALGGAATAMLLVFTLAGIRRDPSPLSLLLAGIAVSFLFSSLLMFLQYFSNIHDSFRIVRWLMGGIETYGFTQVLLMLPPVAIGLCAAIVLAPMLDHLLTGDDIAISHGVNVKAVRMVLIGAATLTVGGVVALCGPIGFVGLMIPHLCRAVFGHGHRTLVPASFLAGGTLLVICDTIARTVAAPAEIPTGVITSLMGGPFFIFLMLRGYDK